MRPAPTSASEFDCLAVNVMGSDIAARKPKANQPSFETILAGGFCSYPGILSELVAPNASGTITLKAAVPVGTQRVVQVLGIVNPNGCANTAAGGDLEDVLSTGVSSKGTTAVYELGRAIANTTSNVTVNITNAYDPANPKDVTCGASNSAAVAGPDCTIAAIQNGTPYATGSGTAADPYHICTLAQLANVDLNLGAQFALAKSIDLTGLTPLATVSPFSGVFDGKGYTLSNFSYTSALPSGTGIFASNTGTIKNLTLSGGNISITTPVNDVGFLVGVNSGSILNITLTSTPTLSFSSPSNNIGLIAGNNTGTVDNITASSGTIVNASTIGNVGGIVGLNDTGTVSNSASSVTVTASGAVGGIVGRNNNGTVTGCSASGAVTGTSAPCSGGALGISLNGGTVSASSSSGAVSGGSSTGGFIGCAYPSTVVSKCRSSGTVMSSSSNVGGFIGEVNGSGTRVELSYSTGNVIGNNNVGGFVGLVTNLGLVRNVYTVFASVAGTSSVGGIAGTLSSGGTLQYAYAIAPTSGLTNTTDHGASVGNNSSGAASNVFATWAMVSPPSSGSGVSGSQLTTATQTQAATYVGFDFTVPGVWTTNGDTTTPRLQ
jgi:hypothetical protein